MLKMHVRYTLYLIGTVYCTYAIAFCTGLNSLRVDQISRENDSQASGHTQLHVVASKLVAVYSAHVLSSLGVA